jgi:uncharacterized membrane protein
MQTERAAMVHDDPMSTGVGPPESGAASDGAVSTATALTQEVAPSLDDPVVNVAAESVGGPLGRRAWRPSSGSARGVGIVARVLVLLTILTMGINVGTRSPCYKTAWNGTGKQQYNHLCYSDVPYMYYGRGFADRLTPYKETGSGDKALEYPVITGAIMETSALLAQRLGGHDTTSKDPANPVTIHDTANEVRWFYNVTTWFLLAFAILTTLALIGLSGRRRWDAALFALAPGLMLTGTINWDLIAVGLATAGMLAWSRKWHVTAGVLLGLGSATKLYPAFLLIPLLVLCWRAGRMRQWSQAAGGAVIGWLAVNLPVMIIAPDGWKYFFTFNRDRAIDLGSIWFAFNHWWDWEPPQKNLVIVALLGAAWLAVALLGLMARRRPRFAQLAFLTIAVFILLNKVYSPQYVLWLIPLAALARPRWRDFLIWQSCEAVYYVSVWYFLVWQSGASNGNIRGLPDNFYVYALLIHVAGTIYFMVQVVRDILDWRRDPVRADAIEDDPAGGVLADSPDVWAWSQPRAHRHATTHGDVSEVELVGTG